MKFFIVDIPDFQQYQKKIFFWIYSICWILDFSIDINLKKIKFNIKFNVCFIIYIQKIAVEVLIVFFVELYIWKYASVPFDKTFNKSYVNLLKKINLLMPEMKNNFINIFFIIWKKNLFIMSFIKVVGTIFVNSQFYQKKRVRLLLKFRSVEKKQQRIKKILFHFLPEKKKIYIFLFLN